MKKWETQSVKKELKKTQELISESLPPKYGTASSVITRQKVDFGWTKLASLQKNTIHFGRLLILASLMMSLGGGLGLAMYPPEVLTIVGEASNQGYRGMLAVGEVIRRRGNLKGFYGLKAKHLKSEPSWVFKQAEKAWQDSSKTNVTNGATHFENEKAFGRPKWAKDMLVTAKIKDHTFYKAVKS